MLYQKDGDTTFYISFDSRSLKPSERNYHANKKELLAVIFALQKNQHILSGRHFTLLTDHHSLVFLHTQKHMNMMLENWLDIIATFKFNVIHLPGIENVIPDALSRSPSCMNQHTTSNLTISTISSPEENPTDSSQTSNSYSTNNRPDLELLHLQGHFQADSMVNWLKDRNFTWQNMKEDCEKIAKNCLICQRCNTGTQSFNPLISIDACKPFDHIQIDLVTDLPTSQEGFQHVCVVVDVASKFSLLRPMKDKTAQSAAKILSEIFRDFGVPRILQSDQGREFDNSLIKKICAHMNIDQRLSSAYSPRTNGLVERTNRTWINIIRKLCSFCQTLWPSFLDATQIFMNNRITKAICTSPFEALFYRKSNLLIDYSNEVISPARSAEQIIADIFNAQTKFWPNLMNKSVSYHTKMTNSFNDNERIRNFNVGDIVFLRNPNNNKLDTLFDGPFRIVNKTQANTFELVDTAGNAFKRRVTTPQLKLAFSQNWISNDDEIFEFEEILSHRGNPNDLEYLVKWKNFPTEDATWIRQQDFTDPRDIKRYWESRGG